MVVVLDTPEQVARDLAERVVRNVIQGMTPVLVATASSGEGLDWSTLALSTVFVTAMTALKFFADWTASADSALWLQMIDRAGSAAAAAVLAAVPLQEPPLDWLGWADFWAALDWPTIGWSALASAMLALIMFYGTPPGAVRAGHSVHGIEDDPEPRHRAA